MDTNETSVELADIVRAHGEDYLERYGWMTSWHQRRVLLDIARCRTAAMGGHVEVCPECGHLRNAYNSCRNRHCPQCLGSARQRWAAAREAELLPVPYFHLVFTLGVSHNVGQPDLVVTEATAFPDGPPCPRL
jgi:hypothetical protein